MRKVMKQLQISGLLLSIVLVPSASAFDGSRYLKQGAEVNLSIENHRQQLLNSKTATETTIRVQRLKLTAYETAYQWLQGGLHIGYLNASHDDALLASGTLPSGQFVGIQLRKPPHESRRYDLHWSLAYSYNRLKDERSTSSNSISWHDTQAEIGFTMRASAFRLSLGGYYARLSGTEQRTNTTNNVTTSSSQSFNSLDNSGSYAAVGYQTSKKGRIELIARSGAQRGAALFFSHQF